MAICPPPPHNTTSRGKRQSARHLAGAMPTMTNTVKIWGGLIQLVIDPTRADCHLPLLGRAGCATLMAICPYSAAPDVSPSS